MENVKSLPGLTSAIQNIAAKASEASIPSKIATIKQEIQNRATLHNVIYVVIMLLSIAVFIGELFVTVKVLQEKHEEIPTTLTVMLMLTSFALVGLAVADRIIAWRHISHITGELQDKIDTCQATLELSMGAAESQMQDVPDSSPAPIENN